MNTPQNMAASNRPTEATYVLHEEVTVDTSDHQDHTFSGIMFPVKCKNILPIDHIIITGLAIRGDLGPISVWVTRDDLDGNFHMDPNVANNVNRARSMRRIDMKKSQWVQIYSQYHAPSRHSYSHLDLSANPIRVDPDRIRGIYIHSELDGDTAIVYDNKREVIKRHDDDFITIFSGRAHVSTEAFGRVPIWGLGNAWRDNREFVGRLEYGVVYKLWSPTIYRQFSGPAFQQMVRTIMTCQKRWPRCPVSKLPDDCIFYIFHMCRWDWSGDTLDQIRKHKRDMLVCASLPEEVTKAVDDASENVSPPIDTSHYAAKDADDFSEEYGDDEEEGSHEVSSNESSVSDEDFSDEDDDGYVDHRGSSSFYFQIFDDFADSSDDVIMAETARSFMENQRRLWLRTQFLQYAAPRDDDEIANEEDEEEEDEL